MYTIVVSSNNKTLNARLLARVITGCHYTTTADVNIHALIAKYGIDIQIVRPEMTKFKTFREFSKHGFLFCGVKNTIFRKAPPSVVSGYDKQSINLNKVVATFEKHIFLSQTDLTRTGIISNTKFKTFREFSKHGFLFCGNYILKYW
jgi:DNA-binding transcriptional regulator of glucitol operon